MNVDFGQTICDCGLHVYFLNAMGYFTCDNPHCANRGKVFQITVKTPKLSAMTRTDAPIELQRFVRRVDMTTEEAAAM